MLTKFYRKSASADATGTLFANTAGVLTRVYIHNANDLESKVRLISSEGMIYFERTLPARGDLAMVLDTYIEDTETIKIFTELAEVHCTVNFLTAT